MSNPFENKHILLGVTGSIAAYKAVDLASKLAQAGALVDVILTQSALKFVSALSFQSVTGRKAYTDAELWGGEGHVVHVGLGHPAELVVIAPVSANTMAKLANGIADNLLTIAALAAAKCPLVLAPAMDAGMFGHPATQANIDTLKKRGAIFIGPVEGHLASGLSGLGRFVESFEILGNLRYILSRKGPLAGKKVVVTAGGTQESIDPVRMITNRSSGKQGYALAQSALDAGADVTLISAPTSLSTPFGAKLINIRSAAEMQQAVLENGKKADALIMAAAVADFRPVKSSKEKIKKDQSLTNLELEPTSDILLEVKKQKEKSGHPKIVIGFAAESEHLIQNARKKLEQKGLDLIVANDITSSDAGFESSTNRVTLLHSDGKSEKLPLLEKSAVADRIIEFLIPHLTT
jgi:phosphopantothenoylcysteine decarboxylase/phosphopantothenate--cysteine ligase